MEMWQLNVMEDSGDFSVNDEADLDKLMVLGNRRSSASIQEKKNL